MKKTLVALAVTAFAASASALTVYDNEGSTVQFDGSVRLLLDQSGKKVRNYEDGATATTKRTHSNLQNDGSRFGVKVKHNLAEDLFAFGRVEFRFTGGEADQFGSLYAHRAYVGLGSKRFGEVSFGRQVTIGDDISQAGFDKTYGVTKTPLTTSGKQVIRYDYKGIEGLQVGVDYRFAEERDKNGEVKPPYENTKGDTVNPIKNGYGVGAVYSFDSATVSAGYTRDNYKSAGNAKHYRDAAMVGGKYVIDNLTLAADYGIKLEKDGTIKERVQGLHTGAKYAITPAVAVYGNYVYLNGKTKDAGELVGKEKSHRFMLGTSYQLHKQVETFVEGSVQRTVNYDGEGVKQSRTTDKAIGVGLRVFW